MIFYTANLSCENYHNILKTDTIYFKNILQFI